MPLLPAICDSCQRLFIPNAISVESVANVRIENVGVGPCPHCDGTGHIPDGIYDATVEGIRVLATSHKSAESLERLRVLLEEARRQKTSAREVADEIEHRIPEFSGLATLLRGLARPELLVALLTLLVTLIATYQTHADSAAQVEAIQAQTQATEAQTKELEHIYSEIVAQSVQEEQPPATGSVSGSPRLRMVAMSRAGAEAGKSSSDAMARKLD